jgi:hypothetical protein
MSAKPKVPDESWRQRWQGVLMVTIVAAFLAAWGVGWIYVRDRFIHPEKVQRDSVRPHEEYVVRAEQVQLTALPPWIHSDVKAEVLRDASLDRPLSLLDDDLAQRIYEAFPLHPWIARVERVTKHYPARIVVDVVYRRPVCVVEVPGGVYPVDENSVLLPSGDFSPVDASRFPLLRGIDTRPGPVGNAWGDERVLEGARLAAALGDVWMELQLGSFSPIAANEDEPDAPNRYELATRSGARILWGKAPDATATAQLVVQAKIARLRQALAEAPATPRRTIVLEGLDGNTGRE